MALLIVTCCAFTGAVGTAGTVAAAPIDGVSSPGTQVVNAFGYSVRVPSSWPVIDLQAAPETCVRSDRSAVYLGRPGAQQLCPPRVLGSAETLVIQPLAGSSSRGGEVVEAAAGTPVPFTAATQAAGRIEVVVPDADVRVTATFPDDASLLRGILDGAALTGSGRTPTAVPVIDAPAGASMAPAAVPAPAAPAATSLSANNLKGYGIDACSTPSVSVMTKWRAGSKYQTAAVYLGGRNWGCRSFGDTPTASWLSSVSAGGWGVLPIWVGYQAPDDGTRCPHCAQMSQSAATAWGQGYADGFTAVQSAQAVGMAPGVTLAYDMEGWDNSNAVATRAVLAYLSAWSQVLHERGFKSSVYTSSCSGGRNLTDAVGSTGPYGKSGASGRFVAPDHMWLASWISSVPTVLSGISCILDSSYPSARARQYRGPVNETYGGATLNADANLFTPMQNPSPPSRLTAGYLKGLYQVLLGRPATSGELAAGTNFFNAGGTGPAMVNGLVTGSEYTKNTVAADYLKLLRRTGDGAGIGFWAGRLASGRRNDVILASLAASDEYYTMRSHADVTTFVSNLYLDLLGRGVDSGGLRFWSDQLTSGNLARDTFALSLADSDECATNLVIAQFKMILGRSPDTAGRAYWVARYLQTHDILELVVNLAASNEGVTFLTR